MYLSLKLGNLHTCEVHQFSCARIVLVHRNNSHLGESNLLQSCLQSIFSPQLVLHVRDGIIVALVVVR